MNSAKAAYVQPDYKKVGTIPFKAVLEYLGVKFTDSDGHLRGNVNGCHFDVTIDKNLYWITEENRGNVIVFTAFVRGCKNSVAARELEDHFFVDGVMKVAPASPKPATTTTNAPQTATIAEIMATIPDGTAKTHTLTVSRGDQILITVE